MSPPEMMKFPQQAIFGGCTDICGLDCAAVYLNGRRCGGRREVCFLPCGISKSSDITLDLRSQQKAGQTRSGPAYLKEMAVKRYEASLQHTHFFWKGFEVGWKKRTS